MKTQKMDRWQELAAQVLDAARGAVEIDEVHPHGRVRKWNISVHGQGQVIGGSNRDLAQFAAGFLAGYQAAKAAVSTLRNGVRYRCVERDSGREKMATYADGKLVFDDSSWVETANAIFEIHTNNTLVFL